jgi:hypothetical protein
MLEPKFPKSKIERDDPSLCIPYKENELPSLLMVLTDKDEPKMT